MLHVTAGNIFTHLYFAVAADGKLLILSNFNDNAMSVSGVCANIGLGNETVRIIENGNMLVSYGGKMEMDSYMTRIPSGKETIYQGLSFSHLINDEYLFIKREQWKEDFYSYLMNRFEFPVLREWLPYIWEEVNKRRLVEKAEVRILGETNLFDGFEIVRTVMTNEDLRDILHNGLLSRNIRIAEKEQKPLCFNNMDDYFQKYGHTLVDNLEKLLKPLSPLKELVDELCFVSKRPFPQQAAIINGAVQCLNKNNYAFLIESMGAGKTLQAMGIAEALFNSKYLRLHPQITVKDIYMDGKLVKYRVIVMCPPHLVEKWAESIRQEIPFARVEVLESLSQLVKLRKQGKKPVGKEFYILSKDSGKLSYSYIPVPYQVKYKKPKIPTCLQCEEEYPFGVNAVCSCGCQKWELDEKHEVICGMVCPVCGELLFPVDGTKAIDQNTGEYRVLMPEDFAQQNTANRFCRCCGEALWAPSCKPIDTRILFHKPKPKKKRWRKISHFSNRAMKGRKSVWILNSWEQEYLNENKVTEEEIEEMDTYGPRRFGMTRYIKKYLKNYFDLAIFDEVQECEFSEL